MIKFNQPPYMEKAIDYMKDAVMRAHICGDGVYTKKCNKWIEDYTGTAKALLTTSCTHALEMAAILLDIKAADEVIMSSYTFASTADAFTMRGAKIVFVDIRPDTMNIDENLIEAAITDKTRAIVVTHYAGVACEMNKIMDISERYNISVVEDAAQGVMSYYKGQSLGTIGDFGCYSFHETKNYSMGEGGALLLKNPATIENAEILREKGTNRSKFWRGEIDKYTWIDKGSSYLPSDLNAAYLWAQLEVAEKINNRRLDIWNKYHCGLHGLKEKGSLRVPHVPEGCVHNAHMYYIKTEDERERSELISYLKEQGIYTVFHYIPLHNAPAGLKYGVFVGEDKYTTKESECLLRLPLYYELTNEDVEEVVETIKRFYQGE